MKKEEDGDSDEADDHLSSDESQEEKELPDSQAKA
jgi:hypothetical protein